MHQYRGKLIVHTGSMFSGKTSSLWKDLKRFEIAGYKTMAFKPLIDTRTETTEIKSHDDDFLEAISIEKLEDLLDFVKSHEVDIIGIDEFQFIKKEEDNLLEILNELLKKGYTIVLAGLDMDSEAVAFENIKEVLPWADHVTKHHAVCSHCGNDAWVSYRYSGESGRILIGSQDHYEPLCRSCYNIQKQKDLAKKDQIKLEINGK